MLQVPNLPTLDRLNATIAPDLDVPKVATTWMESFASFVEAGDAAGIVGLFIEESHWRDMLALTWDFRTFHGAPDIHKFLSDRLATFKITNVRIKDGSSMLLRPYPDIAWISLMFDFETQIGLASGVVRLVPEANGGWKAHCMYTNLEDLKGFPEQIGALRNPAPNHGKWAQERQQAISFENENPVVIIIGGGHSGLDTAARLKCLGVRALVIEKNARIGVSFPFRTCSFSSVLLLVFSLTSRITGGTATRLFVSTIRCGTTTCRTFRTFDFAHITPF
jgi:hypothetical protein